ncbi:MAG: hypothetical protein Q7S41_03225, partial [Candidatus Limnocylindria bacterium]|nr:hypothetical protein [Candidatus Limnocylindria bacterium]
MEDQQEERGGPEPSEPGPENAQNGPENAQNGPQNAQNEGAPSGPRPFAAPAGDFGNRGRRRGRRGRGGAGAGGGQRFGVPPRGPLPPRAPLPPRDDEDSSQARELAAYERRQQQGRPSGPWRATGW